MARSGLSQRDGQRQSGLRQQPLVLLAFVLLVSAAMVSRLVWLQVLEGKRYRELADENRIRLVPRSPTRGRLLDRKGTGVGLQQVDLLPVCGAAFGG